MKIKLPSKKNTLYGICAVVMIVLFVAICINTNLTNKLTKQIEAKQVLSSEENSIRPLSIPKLPSEVLYRLYECGGKIGIYDAKTDILIDIIDVLASTLPVSDRKALKKGIEIYTFADLAKIIDDFTS